MRLDAMGQLLQLQGLVAVVPLKKSLCPYLSCLLHHPLP